RPGRHDRVARPAAVGVPAPDVAPDDWADPRRHRAVGYRQPRDLGELRPEAERAALLHLAHPPATRARVLRAGPGEARPATNGRRRRSLARGPELGGRATAWSSRLGGAQRRDD